MTKSTTINIKDDFSEFPFGRTEDEGPKCGDVFRKEHLIPALEDFDKVYVILDGAKGLGSSFLEQSFGGLIRYHGYKKDDLLEKMEIISEDNSILIEEIQMYIHEA